MNNEKVKDIKEALKLNEYFAIEYLSKSGESKIFTFTDLLTLINDLESENAYKQEHIELWFRKNEEKKNRIAELEKENKDYYDRLHNLQAYIDNHEEIWKGNTNNALKKFAKRLKEISCEMYLKEQLHRCIDETLKEFTDGKV